MDDFDKLCKDIGKAIDNPELFEVQMKYREMQEDRATKACCLAIVIALAILVAIVGAAWCYLK